MPISSNYADLFRKPRGSVPQQKGHDDNLSALHALTKSAMFFLHIDNMDDFLSVINSPTDLITDILGVKSADPDGSKGQHVRILDIAILGPFMILYALLISAPLIVRIILFLIGLFTITYNARNYRVIARQK